MNYAQLGQQVKTKYSQYSDIDDAELGKKIAEKYPQQYGNLITETPEQPQPSQPKSFFSPGVGGAPQGGLDILGKLLNLPSNIMGGATKASRESLTGEYQAPQLGTVDVLGKQIDLGSLLHPALVGAVRGVKENQQVMTELPKTLGVDPESLPGMAIGLAGEVATPDPLDFLKFGQAASTIVSKAGQPVKEAGEKLILKALKPSPSQVTNFVKKTGEDLVDFMTRNKLTQNFVDEAGAKLDDLQNAFDEIAMNSGKKVEIGTLKTAFEKQIDEYSSAIAPALKKKAGDVKEVFDNLAKKFGTEAVDVGDLTKERRSIDALLKEGQFSLAPEAASYYRAVRDILQQAVRDATEDIKVGGRGLKELGQEIHKYIEFEKIAEKQAGLGKGANIIGLLKPLAAMAGAGVGGGVVGGGLGGLVGLGLAGASQSPKVMGILSQLLQSAGGKIQESKVLPKLIEGLLRGTKEEAIKQVK